MRRVQRARHDTSNNSKNVVNQHHAYQRRVMNNAGFVIKHFGVCLKFFAIFC